MKGQKTSAKPEHKAAQKIVNWGQASFLLPPVAVEIHSPVPQSAVATNSSSPVFRFRAMRQNPPRTCSPLIARGWRWPETDTCVRRHIRAGCKYAFAEGFSDMRGVVIVSAVAS